MTIKDADIAAALAEMPDLHMDKRRKFTKREDAILLAAWGKKSQVSISDYLGIAVETLKRRHRELTEGRR